jgi:hypothetical protein
MPCRVIGCQSSDSISSLLPAGELSTGFIQAIYLFLTLGHRSR